jgi:ATP-dependent protease ClpP protease subunit
MKVLCASLIALTALTASVPACAEEMSFRRVTMAARQCGGQCPQVVAAEGEIVEETPDTFVRFLRTHVGDGPLRGILLIDSPGGKVIASMELGQELRKLGMAVVVARVGAEGGPLVSGRCYSACVYALMGGLKRVIPRQSRVGIHRMFNYVDGVDPESGEVLRSRRYADGGMRRALARYSASMGISRDLIALAERTSPDRVHLLSAAEIARWRLGTPNL